jgi:hypothetical protein
MATPERFRDPTDVPTELEPDLVARVSTRLAKLNSAIRSALDAADREAVASVIDRARWARFDVDSALAFKRQVSPLRDAHWSKLRFTNASDALKTLHAFLEASPGSLGLVEMRNLRARLDGLLNVARGYDAAL